MRNGKKWVLAAGVATAGVIGVAGVVTVEDAPLTGVAYGVEVRQPDGNLLEEGSGEKEGDQDDNDKGDKGDSDDKEDDDSSDVNDTDGPGDDEDD